MSSQVSLSNQPNQTEASLVKVGGQSPRLLALQSSLDRVFQFGWQMSAVIDQIPQYWANFWQAYQRLFVVTAWVLGTLITAKIVIAVLVAINSLPLLSSLFQIVGLVYALWFVARYLIGFVSRQEIGTKLQQLRNYILG